MGSSPMQCRGILSPDLTHEAQDLPISLAPSRCELKVAKSKQAESQGRKNVRVLSQYMACPYPRGGYEQHPFLSSCLCSKVRMQPIGDSGIVIFDPDPFGLGSQDPRAGLSCPLSMLAVMQRRHGYSHGTSPKSYDLRTITERTASLRVYWYTCSGSGIKAEVISRWRSVGSMCSSLVG